jgi:hypothetical protein
MKRRGLNDLPNSSISARKLLTRSKRIDSAAQLVQLPRSGLRQIVRQAIQTLEQVYVHLPQKCAAFGINPVQQLRLLARETDTGLYDGRMLSFHHRLAKVFRSLRDLHTVYQLPFPFSAQVAFLPFQIECYFRNGKRAFIISNVAKNLRREGFHKGAQVTHWNGTPIEIAVRRRGEETAGSNEAACFARGLESLTVRPLMSTLPPDEAWVSITYRSKNGKKSTANFQWRSLFPPTDVGAASEASPADKYAVGLDYELDAIRRTKKILFAPQVFDRPLRMPSRGNQSRASNQAANITTHQLGQSIEAKAITSEKQRVGYLRIRTFNVDDADAFVRHCVDLVRELPQTGLIVDVRDNGGGLIYAAERLLQIFTPRTIEPAQFQFINSQVTEEMCRRNHPRQATDDDTDLRPWKDSIQRSVESGAIYSQSFPITSPGSCNSIGQQYYGPVVLIVNALCYSATDIFAAGFQDNRVGLIVGVDTSTGAGGANVWTNDFLGARLEGSRFATHRLPLGAGFTVAARRALRAGINHGLELENFGVVPDFTYQMTKNDLLDQNVDLVRFAADVVLKQRSYYLNCTVDNDRDGQLLLRCKTSNIDRVDIFIDDAPLTSVRVNQADLALRIPSGHTGGKLDIQGMRRRRLVARFKADLETPVHE